MLYVFCIGKNATSQGQNVWKLVDLINTLSGVNKVTDTPKGDHNKPERMCWKDSKQWMGRGGGGKVGGRRWVGSTETSLGCRRLIVSNLWAFAHNDKISELLNTKKVSEKGCDCVRWKQLDSIAHHPVLQGLTRCRCWLTALCTPDRRNDYDNRTLCVGTSRPLRCININLLISGRILMTSDSLTFPYIEKHLN